MSYRPLWTIADLRTYLSVSDPTIWAWVSQGKIPAPADFGREKRWIPEQVEEWVRSMASGLIAVRFLQEFAPYNLDEVAGFSERDAARLVVEGLAELIEPSDRDRIHAHLVAMFEQRREWVRRELLTPRLPNPDQVYGEVAKQPQENPAAVVAGV